MISSEPVYLRFAGYHAFERAFFSNTEYHNIELAFAAEGESGGIHHFEVFQQGFVKVMVS